MKMGIFGDIHGNIDALKAAHEAAVLRKVDKMCHLGDVGGYAPFVNEVVDFLVEHGIEGVQGNYDEAVANDREHCGCKYEDPVQAMLADKSFAWTTQHASHRSKAYMRGLPTAVPVSSHGKKILLFHAAPHKNNLYWFEDRPEKFFLEMAAKTDADVLIYGHTHTPYRKEIAGRIFINAGSVGKPKDGDPRACLTLVDITDEGVASEVLRVPYDIEKVATAIRESGLPELFAEKLREAT